jgi:hypothetical protein
MKIDGYDIIITFINGLTKQFYWIATIEDRLSAKKFAKLFIDFYV